MNLGQPFHEDDTAANEADIKEMDVLNGRGKVDHPGNAFYRKTILEHCPQYKEYWMRKDRKGMNEVVQSIIDKVHASGGRFMEQNWRKMWIEVTPKVRKQKVERACRDTKTTNPRNSTSTTGISTDCELDSRVPPVLKSLGDLSMDTPFHSANLPLQYTNESFMTHSHQQTNIANIAPHAVGDDKIARVVGGAALPYSNGTIGPPIRNGILTDDFPKKNSRTWIGDSDEVKKSTAGLGLKPGEMAVVSTPTSHQFEQDFDLDQLNTADHGKSLQEEQKFQVAATLVEFSSCSRDFTHTPDLDFSCGSLSYNSGEADHRRVGQSGMPSTAKPSFEDAVMPQSSGAQMGCSKSSLWSSMASLDLFRVDEMQQHTGVELGDSAISMLNDMSMMDLASDPGEKDSSGRLLSSQQFDSSRTLPTSNKRKSVDDSLSDLLNGSLDFNDAIQEGKHETSELHYGPGARQQQRVKCGTDGNATKLNASQQGSLDYLLQLSVSSEGTNASQMSISGMRSNGSGRLEE